jgi:CHRD domain-containing protein
MRALRMLTMFAAVVAVGSCNDKTVTAIPSGLEVYTATLNGANERPTPVTTTATGSAIVTVLGNQVSWKVDILTPIDSIFLGHIHRFATDSMAGNVVVNFNPPATGVGFTGTATLGSAIAQDSVIALMRAGRGYVNIHTKKNPGGEIRGNLIKQ